MHNHPKIAVHSSGSEDAQQALEALQQKYDFVSFDEADIIIVLGGDGTMLETLHRIYKGNKSVYGMNFGSVGFLMNPYRAENLYQRIENSHRIEIHPLRMTVTDQKGDKHEAFAFNEVSLLRQSRQAAKIKISVDGVERINELICDGVLLSTPAGSTAYNLSAHGPILPLSANVLALTPISAFRPRRWRGALLPSTCSVKLDVLEADKRPVSGTADFTEIRNISSVEIHQSEKIGCPILFDPDHNLEERILKEQFLP